jgi:hypothetical protein
MQRREIRETDRFLAQTDAGKRYTIVEYTTYIEAAHFEGSSWVEGLKTLKTTSGQHVNFRGQGQYELIDGTPLTRV